ncbi:hypothetical protein V6N13_122744 [Hibiscus sabdariffa]
MASGEKGENFEKLGITIGKHELEKGDTRTKRNGVVQERRMVMGRCNEKKEKAVKHGSQPLKERSQRAQSRQPIRRIRPARTIESTTYRTIRERTIDTCKQIISVY